MRFGVNLPGPFFVTTGGGRRRRRRRRVQPYGRTSAAYRAAQPKKSHRTVWLIVAGLFLLGATIAFWYVMIPVYTITAVVLWRRPAWRARMLHVSQRALKPRVS
jgi:cytochrome c biogenesis protein CcdA